MGVFMKRDEHGWIASVCLEFLSFVSCREFLAARLYCTCDCFEYIIPRRLA